jgi:hypothetical protein
MPLQATSGAASYDAFGGGAAVAPKYIEDFFQTWLRAGTGASATVNTGLNASTNKSLVWSKSRSAATNHKLTDTVRGATKALISNTTGAETTDSQGLTAFSSTGYTIGTNTDYNNSGATYVDWQWLATPKFFDVVTYTGTGSARTIAHDLGSVPGCIIIKSTTRTSDWVVYHRSVGSSATLILNSTVASANYGNNISSVTSTSFSVTGGSDSNANGDGYVAYVFAHNAGGFGLTGTDNVISCGSFTTSSYLATVDLGYEPQWLLVKRSDSTGDWFLLDTMRGLSVGVAPRNLKANTSAAEGTGGFGPFTCLPTGFSVDTGSGPTETYIYIAIRRGPMKVPTTGTSVFSANTQTGAGTSAGQTLTTNFPVDLEISSGRSNNSGGNYFVDRLRGSQNYIQATNTNAEVNFTSWNPLIGFANNTGITDANYGSTSSSYVAWNFRRAPGFFDEVCYTGTGANRTVAHNLAVVPELIITKMRSSTQSWFVFSNITPSNFRRLVLNLDWSSADNTGGISSYNTGWGLWAAPTSTLISVDDSPPVNSSGQTYVSYLFASCPGVSKVGSYTGTGATQVINCGFTGGARFVLIKATSTTGNWLVWDSARGIVSGNDPYLALNSTAAEVTNTDWVDTAATGFELSNAGGNLANSNGVSYVFLAIS